MWTDNSADFDYLNFACVAETTAELIEHADNEPISIGVSGGWGVGKSSMVGFIRESLEEKEGDYIFIDFNAWLYQGYDDARAALVETIGKVLIEQCEENEALSEKAKDLLSRVKWLRFAGLGANIALSLSMGKAPSGITGDEIEKLIEKRTPPEEIQQIREYFEEILETLGATLVVFVDDLDRCLPRTAISTLEAIRLLLFVKRTAFIIAADEQMIRNAVKNHFDLDSESKLITNYFDKLIQIPVRVPPLGTQEVRAYLMMLFMEESELPDKEFNRIRQAVCQQLAETWQGKRVDREFINSLIKECPDTLSAQLEIADRIAPVLTSAPKIEGNPRLIKRFLNSITIKKSIAKIQNVTVEESDLIKMLLFERCVDRDMYTELIKAISEDKDGKPTFLEPWEKSAVAGEKIEGIPPKWDDKFVYSWLALPPQLHDKDLRAAVYLSRDFMPPIYQTDEMTPEGANLYRALLEIHDGIGRILIKDIAALERREISAILRKLLEQARRIQEWGTPSILYACLTVVEADKSQEGELGLFLRQIPPKQITPDLIPLIDKMSISGEMFSHWSTQPELAGTVKKAIERQRKQ